MLQNDGARAVESWHASTRAIAHALLKELFETCAFAVQSCKTCRLWGLRQAGSQEPRVCAPDAQQQKFNCKGKIAARGPFSVYTSVRNKATRLDWRRELAAGLQGCCTLCWSARERPAARAAQREARETLASLAARWRVVSIYHEHHREARARRRRAHTATQTTQIIASSASRCRAFANRVALRRQK